MESQELYNDTFFNRLRNTEYAKLDKSGHVYLDYTGANIFPQCLLEEHYEFLQNAVYGNPHSNNSSSQLSGKYVSEAREKVLEYFNAKDYYCVFTSNASAALQIVGECYPFSRDSHLLLTADNHNSVNGIREYCKSRGGAYSYCPMNQQELSINEENLNAQLKGHANKKNKLFGFPAQSNASGVKHSLSWIWKAQDQGWDVLLDAAAFVPASKLDLTTISPDFVCISFYKMFGYPTGLGCLLVKKSKFLKLKKPWFAGGTVSLVSINSNNFFLADDSDRFENGTVNYLDIPAITNGLKFINGVQIGNITRRIQELTGLALQHLMKVKHDNGLPVIKIYGPKDTENRGGTILLNFFDRHGQQYPYQSIEKIANENSISFRTGCFCNPGIDEINSGIRSEQLNSYFASRDKAGYDDMVGFLGKLRGAIRVSVGIPTVTSDISKFLEFAKSFMNTSVSPFDIIRLRDPIMLID
ncbi:MAG: aminotransferase class V-fold PLP-dependent enzyme [Chitinophagaceae bacterium]|nr:aminotransferase class V-fold PLP-dependent enzyme [Chitinophagaceae bacterium]